jgi:hypothetical protein
MILVQISVSPISRNALCHTPLRVADDASDEVSCPRDTASQLDRIEVELVDRRKSLSERL